ncbi:7-cyano-7-deazaguanine/7-aminomethyl-7-deazaguanine transporter [Marinomonas sp. S3726]|uniref:7-cyano-7-deazaguanine/7-aminomethyl-7- deazaguanine transporter n=1 Tax=Marinomonas sp. S3726 TaxID=579484 RepID=UPI0009FDF163|nr:7-cyano-7-deazaguanine/7-aminomethyl-7-deazaguanine transporter [Marinomonas sp. S3726]
MQMTPTFDALSNNASTIKKALLILAGFHILILASSNYLVQLPFTIFGLHTTWGAFTFPFVFLATDLTVRLYGAALARRIILTVMLPALLVSYVASVLFYQGSYQGIEKLAQLDTFVARIAIASFAAYVVGQVMDVTVFNKLRQAKAWWIAPSLSTVVGNAVDTLVFFGVAFYQSSDAFMAENWVEIALVDYGFKLIISLCMFVPLYGVLLNKLSLKLAKSA